MSYTVFIAVALGLAAGLLVGYRSCKIVSRGLSTASRTPRLIQGCSWAGAFVFLLPSFVLSFVVGGTLGGSWAEAATSAVGLGSFGVPVGLATGVAVVLATGLSLGLILGGLLGKALSNASRR